MFFDWLLHLSASLAGFSDSQLDTIEKSMPATRRLIDLVVKSEPQIKQATALMSQAAPLINEASEELKTIAPAINIILAVVQRDLAAGKSANDAIKNIFARLGQATPI